MRFNWLLVWLLGLGLSGWGQATYEREFRIRKEQFPSECLDEVSPYLSGAKKLRFYKEIDSSQYRYRLKFKMDRLFYQVDFDQKGGLDAISIDIKPLDIPDASWEAIQKHLGETFEKYKVRDIRQVYPRKAFTSDSELFRNAYQNLILPEIRYGLLIRGKKNGGKKDYSGLYDQEGRLIRLRESLPPNYDHVLY